MNIKSEVPSPKVQVLKPLNYYSTTFSHSHITTLPHCHILKSQHSQTLTLSLSMSLSSLRPFVPSSPPLPPSPPSQIRTNTFHYEKKYTLLKQRKSYVMSNQCHAKIGLLFAKKD